MLIMIGVELVKLIWFELDVRLHPVINFMLISPDAPGLFTYCYLEPDKT